MIKASGGQCRTPHLSFPSLFRRCLHPLDKLPPRSGSCTLIIRRSQKAPGEAGYPNGFTFKARSPVAARRDWISPPWWWLIWPRSGSRWTLKYWIIPLFQPDDKKNHSEGYFFPNDTAVLLRDPENFLTGQTWNPHMMSDPYVDKLGTISF